MGKDKFIRSIYVFIILFNLDKLICEQYYIKKISPSSPSKSVIGETDAIRKIMPIKIKLLWQIIMPIGSFTKNTLVLTLFMLYRIVDRGIRQ